MIAQKVRYSVGVRLVMIGMLSLVLLIPLFMIQELIREREATRNESIQEVSSKWGRAQTIAGPVLTIPVQKSVTAGNGAIIKTVQYAHFLPDDLAISGVIQPEIRYRGIYEVILYGAKLRINGKFRSSNLKGFTASEAEMLWSEAFIAVGVTDMKSIKDSITTRWNDKDLTVNSGIPSQEVLASGISSPVALNTETEEHVFSLDLHFNGSEQLSFIPIGKETRVKISGNWGDPSFVGEFLPEAREIKENEFSAEWKVLHLNRNYPQCWIGKSHAIEPSAFGVRFLLPVDEYQKIMRTAKYAVMFIALTFLTFFMIEILNKKVLHPIQYLLIGFALLLFYTLLLSFSEHVGFQYAYLVASISMTALITAYTKAVLSNNLLAAFIAGVLIALYSFLYVVLQLQDYALLLGSVGLFLILALVMYLTRKIDWYALWKSESTNGGNADLPAAAVQLSTKTAAAKD